MDEQTTGGVAVNTSQDEQARPNRENTNILTYIRIKSLGGGSQQLPPSVMVNEKEFFADRLLCGPDQEELFRLIRKTILEKCLLGYNCSVFAYGQTGSGKTYTIQGTDENPGLVIRSMFYLHESYDSIRFSFIEIYNENMFDLLAPENAIGIREDPQEGVTVDNLTIIQSTSSEESIKAYNRGISNRKTASTNMNMRSSRSHSIFTVLLERKDRGVVRRSKLCFVDLAGSERCREIEAERMKETCNINKSLLCLGTIVNKLSVNDRGHLSYRDSKLTFLLKDSLGGNSRLAIIGNVGLENPQDSLSTLLFLQRSKCISNHPSINYDVAGSSAAELAESLKQLDCENQQLKEEIALLRREQEHGIKNGMLHTVKKFKGDIFSLRKSIDDVKSRLFEMVDLKYFYENALLQRIDGALARLNEERKENLRNIAVKKVRGNTQE